MKKPDLQRSHTTEEMFPSNLQVAEEKFSNINIYKNSPIEYKNSPFEARNNERKKYPNEQIFSPNSNSNFDENSQFSEEKSEEIYKNKKRNEIINYISEPYYNNLDDKKKQKKIQKMINLEEIDQKRKESPGNGKDKKKRKKRPVKVEITKTEGNNYPRYKDLNKFSKSLNPNRNDEYMFYVEVPNNDEEGTLDNVSFSNKNIDTNNYNQNRQRKVKDKIDPNILKQFKLISEVENNKLIQKLEKEKEKLKKENQKLNKNYKNFEKEKEKFEKEKKLFFESRNRVIDDTRKNEERLIKLENELENKFMAKKNEIQQMREQLKQEQSNLDNERNNMRNNYQIRLSKLEEDYKIKEETQNYNNNLNIDKTRKEQEILRQKEKEINELKKTFMERENNLNMRENELINKENELQEKEENLNNKYQNLLKKEKDLKGEKEKFLNSNEENEKDLFMKSQQLKDKEEQLANRENMLLNKENELSNRENMLSSVENQLKNRENQLNETQNKLFDRQNEINDKENKINLLNKEIKDKRNQLIELNNNYNEMMSKMNSPKTQKSNLENSKGSKEIQNEINNFESMNRPSISAVKKLDRKFNPNESNNMNLNTNLESQPINKVVTFGNKNSVQSNLTNNKNDVRDNDSYPENNLNDIKDSDAFPENHLHDIQDNDQYPENHGEDDFVYGNNNINNDNLNNNNINNNNINNNNINNDNNNDDGEYEDLADDFDQYINNQSHQSQNNKSQNMNENNNNMNLPMDEQPPSKNGDDHTEPYNLFQENNNNLMESKNNEFNSDIQNSLPKNNDNNINNFQGDNNNPNDINKRDDSESGEIDLNNLKKEELEFDGSQNQEIQNNNNINDHEDEIKEIMEELYIEEYNPSLGLIKLDYPTFLNSLIQCFAHIPDITDKIVNLHLDLNFKNNLPNLKLTNSYRNLLINLFFPEKVYNMERQAFNPTKFRNTINELNPHFENNENIELKEFINYFILKLHDDLNIKKDALSQYQEKKSNEVELKNENDVLVDFLKGFTEKNNSIISKNLYGITKFTLYCNQCQNSFYNFQCYSHLYFNIDNVLDFKINRHHREDVDLELSDFLEYYQKSETLRGDNGMFCPSCKTQTESTSIKTIYSTKNVIIFILDRNIGKNFNKIYVNIDENLNLRDYVEYKKEGEKSREKFFLGGVINYYMGNDEQSGTYNAFVRMGRKNDWYCYEDENVYSVTFDDIKNNGYPVVLFYHKLTKKKT